MTLSRFVACLGLAAGLFLLTGCNNNMKSENERLLAENQSLRDQLGDQESALQSLDAERAELVAENSRLRMEREDLRSQQPAGGGTGFDNIPGVQGERRAGGEVAAVVEGDILFASGSATLRNSAKQTLDRVIGVLNSTYSGQMIRIEGHTDADPIRKSGWKTNDRLSCERALSVKEYLESKGVAGSRIHVAGFGSTKPRETKEKSRRVEIVVIGG